MTDCYFENINENCPGVAHCDRWKCRRCHQTLTTAEDAFDPHIQCARLCFDCTVIEEIEWHLKHDEDEVKAATSAVVDIRLFCVRNGFPVPVAFQED